MNLTEAKISLKHAVNGPRIANERKKLGEVTFHLFDLLRTVAVQTEMFSSQENGLLTVFLVKTSGHENSLPLSLHHHHKQPHLTSTTATKGFIEFKFKK